MGLESKCGEIVVRRKMSLRRKNEDQQKHVLAKACTPPNPRPVTRSLSETGAGYKPWSLSPAYSLRREVAPSNVSVVDAVFRQMGLATDVKRKREETKTDGLESAEPGSSTPHPEPTRDRTAQNDVWFVSDLEGGLRTYDLLQWIFKNGVQSVHLGDSGDIGPISTHVIESLNLLRGRQQMQTLVGNRDWNVSRLDEIISVPDAGGHYKLPGILIQLVGRERTLYWAFYRTMQKYMEANNLTIVQVQFVTVILFYAINRLTRGTDDAYWNKTFEEGNHFAEMWRSLSTSPNLSDGGKWNEGIKPIFDTINVYISEFTAEWRGRTLTDGVDWIEASGVAERLSPAKVINGVDIDDKHISDMYSRIMEWKTALEKYVQKSNVLYYNASLGVLGVHDWFGADAGLLKNRQSLACTVDIHGEGSAYTTPEFDNTKANELRWTNTSREPLGNWCDAVNEKARSIVEVAFGTNTDEKDACRRYMADIADAPSKSFMHGLRPANYLDTIVEGSVSTRKELPNFIMVGHQPNLLGRMGSKSYEDASGNSRRCTLVEIDTQFTPFCRSVARVFSKTTPSVDRDPAIDTRVTQIVEHARANLFPAKMHQDGPLKGFAAWSLGLVVGFDGSRHGVVCVSSFPLNRLITYKVGDDERGHHAVRELCVLGSLCFLRKSTDNKGDKLQDTEVYEALTPGPQLEPEKLMRLHDDWCKRVTPFMQGLQDAESTGALEIVEGDVYALTSYSHSCDKGVQNHALTPPVA